MAYIPVISQGTGNAAGSPWSVSGSVSTTQATSPWITSGGVTVSNFPASQTVAGSVSVQGQQISGSGVSTNPLLMGGVNGTTAHYLLADSAGNLIVVQGTTPWTVSGGVSLGSPIPPGSNIIGKVSQDTSPWITSGGVTVSNFPSTQTVAGTVSGNQGVLSNNAYWSVSGQVSITNTPSVNQGTSPWVTSGGVTVSNFPASQTIAGTITANQGTAQANSTPWPVKSIYAGKATYSSSSSGGVTTAVAVNTIQSIGYLWHPAVSALRYQIQQITLTVPMGASNAGQVAFQLKKLTGVGTGGSSGTVIAYDSVDAASSALFITGGNAPTRAAGVVEEYILNFANSWSGEVVLDFTEILEGKPLVMRANQAEGWEISMSVFAAITTAQRIGASFTWTEE